MDTAVIAIFISSAALAISAISFIWSVRTFYVNPKPKVEVSIGQIHRGGLIGPQTGSALRMDVVNHGPGNLVISDILRSVWIKKPKYGRGSKSLHLNLYSGRDHPFSGATEDDLPIKLAVGDSVTFFYADYTLMGCPEHFEDTEIGVIDTFGRAHIPRHSQVQDCLLNIHKAWTQRENAREAERQAKADNV